MTRGKRARIFRLAVAFRAAILRGDQRHFPLPLKCFPRGACGEASELLAKYLEEQGLGTFQYVFGIWSAEAEEHFSHVWLEQGNVIVDIAADQFPEVREAVIVTTDRTWHDNFGSRSERRAIDSAWPVSCMPSLHTAYRHIVELMNDSDGNRDAEIRSQSDWGSLGG